MRQLRGQGLGNLILLLAHWKPARICFDPGRKQAMRPQFRLGSQIVPQVQQYTCLGIVFHEKLQWRHVDTVFARGKAWIAACLSWTTSEDLPDSLTECVFQTDVCPSAQLGIEFVTQNSQPERMNRRIFQREGACSCDRAEHRQQPFRAN